MALPALASYADRARSLTLRRVATYPGVRVLCWNRNDLYMSRGYELLCVKPGSCSLEDWEHVGSYPCESWRRITSSTRLTFRLFRDGFHALTVLPTGHIVGAVPGKIVTLSPGEKRFHVTHLLSRGTRPLHITAGKNGRVFWGEYFDNPQRSEVHIYGSDDYGDHWEPVYTFPAGKIRHVHNAVFDVWGECYWVLTGDQGAECQILRASFDFVTVETMLSGSQQVRSAAFIPTPDSLYFSTDTPFEQNSIYRLERTGKLSAVTSICGSSIYGCRVGQSMFFSTMVEPTKRNTGRDICIYASSDGQTWRPLQQWPKDFWPMGLFQYGNAFLPDGTNETDLLAVTTIGVKNEDLLTSFFRVEV